MFSCLTSENDIPFADLVVGKEVVESATETAFQSSRRTHSCTERHIAGECHVEALDIDTEETELLYHAIYEASPLCRWSLWIVDLELYLILEVDGIGNDGICAVRTHLSHHTLCNSTWKDEASVIVGMLANEIDASWRMVDVACKTVKMLYETTSYEFNIHIKTHPQSPPIKGGE